MTLVYLDANVLVPSYTRTLLVMSAPLSDFTVAWSLHAEAEEYEPRRRDRVDPVAGRLRLEQAGGAVE